MENGSEQFCYELIKENINALLDGRNNRVSQSEYIDNGHCCYEYKAKTTIEKSVFRKMKCSQKKV
jgi:hypothetical protein